MKISIGVDARYNHSKVPRIPVSKVHINGKINTRIEKKMFKPMFNGPDEVINQLITSI
jgi:hypothetical protein